MNVITILRSVYKRPELNAGGTEYTSYALKVGPEIVNGTKPPLICYTPKISFVWIGQELGSYHVVDILLYAGSL